MLKQDCLFIGKVVKSHGIHGELIVETSESGLFEDTKESVLLEINGLLVPFFFSTHTQQSAQRFRVKFLWIESADKANDLVGCEIYVPTHSLKADYSPDSPHAYIGFEVRDEKHGLLGEVSNFYNHTNNPLLAVGTGRDEILIPLHEDFIVQVDLALKKLVLSLPDGLLDVYSHADDSDLF